MLKKNKVLSADHLHTYLSHGIVLLPQKTINADHAGSVYCHIFLGPFKII